MTTDLKGRDFLSTQDWSVEELETLFRLAAELKQANAFLQTAKPSQLTPLEQLSQVMLCANEFVFID